VGQERLARDLGVTRSAITKYITILKKKNYVEILNKGRKLNFTSTMRVVYNEKLCAADAIAVAASTEDLRSPMMIRDEEMEMVKKAPKTSVRAVKTIREYIDTKQENKSVGEATVTYNSKLEIVELLYGKVYIDKKTINDLDLKAIEIAESIGLSNQQFAHDLELWLRARPERPDSIIDYSRGL
jgi:DNA-binding transcriptional regulator YiaG